MYTNKTWSEVSGIELGEVNRMEREFLLGLDFDFYVNKLTYESWLKFLTGLVMNKEKDSKQWQRTTPFTSCSSYSTLMTSRS